MSNAEMRSKFHEVFGVEIVGAVTEFIEIVRLKLVSINTWFNERTSNSSEELVSVCSV